MYVFFIKSVSKVAIIAFFLTGFFLIYEFYLLLTGEKKSKKTSTLKVPEFSNMNIYHKPKILTFPVKNNSDKIFKKPNLTIISFLIIFMFLLGAIILVGVFLNRPNPSETNNLPNISPSPIDTSSGIFIYNKKWEEINGPSMLSFLKGGDRIFIGVKNISGVEQAAKARIRVNSDHWEIMNETETLNKQFNVFYKEYRVATGETKLRIQAQLYYPKEEWPVD
ncbi:MAG: hypothetical protein ACD_24C00478G0001 [uncultured bacterium]|nr:MAG: hypothetical protein ACD_24C00478G0001 [uncultured bacterium]